MNSFCKSGQWNCTARSYIQAPTNPSNITIMLWPLLLRLLLLITTIDRIWAYDYNQGHVMQVLGHIQIRRQFFAQKSFYSMCHSWQSWADIYHFLYILGTTWDTTNPLEEDSLSSRCYQGNWQQTPLTLALPYTRHNITYLWLAGTTLGIGFLTAVFQLQNL